MNTSMFLNERKCWYERVPHHSTYSAQQLAHELHVPGREVAKTVLLRTVFDGGCQYLVAVLPANKNVDFTRVAALLKQEKTTREQEKVMLATEPEMASHLPDCELGVLPPFGSHYGMKTIVDSSLAKDEEIWFEGNTHKEAIHMRFDDFQRLEQPWIAMIARAR